MDTSYHFDIRFAHKTQKTTSSSKNYEFDSRQPADTSYPAEWAKFIKPIGEANQVVLDKLGYIISRTDSTESNEGVQGMIPDMNSGATSKRKTYDLVADLPAMPVKVGDTWTDSSITEKTKQYSRSKPSKGETITSFKAKKP